MNSKLCKKCGSPDLVKGRRTCKKCECERFKEYYLRRGAQKRRGNISHCVACNSEFTKRKKEQVVCPQCYKESKQTNYVNNNYIYDKKGKVYHRVIAESVLQRPLLIEEVVHHLDENTKNNNLDNLWVMNNADHGRLHCFLRLQRVIYEKSLDKDSVNCWNTLRVDQTKAWLEMTGANVIKLIELGNQQPSS